jgi:phage terminase large subunit
MSLPVLSCPRVNNRCIDMREQSFDTEFNWDDENDSRWDVEVVDWDNPPPLAEPDPVVTQERATDLWVQFLEKYGPDPVAFAEEVLRIKLMRHQRRMLQSVANKKRRIALRSGHRVGKTMVLAIISLWHLVTKYPQKTLITAPTSGQLFNALFPEIKTLAKRLPDFIYELFNWYSEEISLKADPDGSFLAARTASPENAESFQGIHSHNVLFIWDEASGVDERLFNAARGSMASPNAIQILAGNPVRLNNTFHRAFTVNSELYDKHHVSSVGIPTVDPDFIKEVADTHGIDSNEYRVRVLGEFPDTEDESFIPTHLVRAARARDIKRAPLSAVIYGVDPARQGNDRSVITRRVGLHVIEDQFVFNKKNTMQLVGEIVALADKDRNRLIDEFKEYNRPLLFLPPVPAAIVVDVIGIGAGVVDRLLELGFNVISVNVAEAATSQPMCYRERDAMWLNGKKWLEDMKGKLPDDEILQNELTAPHYEYSSNGVLKIESKDSVKKRGMRSPDKADSFLLSLMAPPEVITGFLQAPGEHYGYGSGPKGKLTRSRGR